MESPADTEPRSCSVVVPVRDDAAELRGLLEALVEVGGFDERFPRAYREDADLALRVRRAGWRIAEGGRVTTHPPKRGGFLAVARAAGCIVLTHPLPSIAAAAAAGYDVARGDLIVRCDADSRPSPGWLGAHRLAHARSGPRTVLVTGPGRFRIPAPLGELLSGLYVGTYLLCTAAALGHFPAFGTTMSMRRAWWHEVREETSRSAEVHDDMDLSFRVRPGQRVQVTRTVAVGMSPRALRVGHDPLRRWRRATRTLRRNWRLERPWQRWAARLTAPGRRR